LYCLNFTNPSKKDLKKINKSDRIFILDRLKDFVNNFNTDYEISLMQKDIIKKLKGQKEDIYRLKLRSYRVVYKKEDNILVILILNVTTREGAYKLVK
jgi:mRNA interferase RelE/StbE